MNLFQSYYLLENSKLSHHLNIWSIVVFAVLLAGCTAFVDWRQIQVLHFDFIQDALLFFGGYLGTTLAHEGIHATFFKLFAPKVPVSFSWKRGLSYATSSGSYFSKRQYGLIAMAPFLLLTLFGGLYLVFAGAYFWAGLLLITHTATCVGDFYWLSLLVKAPKNVLVADTATGMDLYLPTEK